LQSQHEKVKNSQISSRVSNKNLKGALTLDSQGMKASLPQFRRAIEQLRQFQRRKAERFGRAQDRVLINYI